MPALLTRTSRRPNFCATAARACLTPDASATSQQIDRIALGSGNAAQLRLSASASISSNTTRQVSVRNRLAVARPIPRAAPVTIATFCIYLPTLLKACMPDMRPGMHDEDSDQPSRECLDQSCRTAPTCASRVSPPRLLAGFGLLSIGAVSIDCVPVGVA